VGVAGGRGVVSAGMLWRIDDGGGVGTTLSSVMIGRLDIEEVGVAVSSSGTLLLKERGSRNNGTLDVGVN
jgi:hypothetical protein